MITASLHDGRVAGLFGAERWQAPVNIDLMWYGVPICAGIMPTEHTAFWSYGQLMPQIAQFVARMSG